MRGLKLGGNEGFGPFDCPPAELLDREFVKTELTSFGFGVVDRGFVLGLNELELTARLPKNQRASGDWRTAFFDFAIFADDQSGLL